MFGVFGLVRFRQLMSCPCQLRIGAKVTPFQRDRLFEEISSSFRPSGVPGSARSGMSAWIIRAYPPALLVRSRVLSETPSFNAATVTSVKAANAIRPTDSTLREVLRDALRIPKPETDNPAEVEV